MPGHFLLKHFGPDGHETLIDCFNRGDILSRQECQIASERNLLRRNSVEARVSTSAEPAPDPDARCSTISKTVYLSTRNFRKALPSPT